MPNTQKIEHLIALLGAESQEVRESVRKELENNVELLETWVRENKAELPPETQFVVEDLIHNQQSDRFRDNWLDWLDQADDAVRLERAFENLSSLSPNRKQHPPLNVMLDKLARQFMDACSEVNALELNSYLFQEGRFKGSQDNYYHPDRSNLALAIATGKGLPITLAVMFMLTGRRAGISIQGVNLPGHFLTQSEVGGKTVMFDCFNGGKVLVDKEFDKLTHARNVDINKLLQKPPTAYEIVQRVLVNMVNAYFRAGDLNQYHMCCQLLNDLRKTAGKTRRVRGESSHEPLFQAGSLVRHKRYGYRGVVVEYDLNCSAPDAWYKANQTQPDRNQPWYHILVNESEVSTYAAESSLMPDSSGQEIDHPMITVYFEKFEDGRYIRNDAPW